MKQKSIRKPFFAGSFYPESKKELESELKRCFSKVSGIAYAKKKKVSGAVCPHAGIIFSGTCAAFSYRAIAESALPETFVILGTCHSGFGSCISLAGWETPLGVCINDSELGLLLSEQGIPVSEEWHSKEHSIEVQLPFVQFIAPDAKICPVLISDDISYSDTAFALISSAEKLGRSIIIIASGDFSHCGPAYSSGTADCMEKLDMDAIRKMIDSGAKGFLEIAENKRMTICGKAPIAVLAEAMSIIKAKPRLLKYCTSKETSGDYENAVGYASIIFEK